jgi:hypothetical protein
MAKCGDLGIVMDVTSANEILVINSQSHVATDPRQAADWRAFGLGGFAFGQHDPLAVAFFVEERVDLFFF